MMISEIMSKNVYCINLDKTLVEIREIFAKNHFHHLLVKEERKLVGVISDRDILKEVSPFIATVNEQFRDLQTLKKKAHQIMTRNPITVLPDTPVEEVAKIFIDKKVSCVPVLSHTGALVGIATWRDLIRAIFKMA